MTITDTIAKVACGQAEAGDDAAAAIAAYLALPDVLDGIGVVLGRALGVTMTPAPFCPGACPHLPAW